LDSQATPYSDDQCRCWFRDMILGIEYRKNHSLRSFPRVTQANQTPSARPGSHSPRYQAGQPAGIRR
jgi:hypothetical protein